MHPEQDYRKDDTPNQDNKYSGITDQHYFLPSHSEIKTLYRIIARNVPIISKVNNMKNSRTGRRFPWTNGHLIFMISKLWEFFFATQCTILKKNCIFIYKKGCLAHSPLSLIHYYIINIYKDQKISFSQRFFNIACSGSCNLFLFIIILK